VLITCEEKIVVRKMKKNSRFKNSFTDDGHIKMAEKEQNDLLSCNRLSELNQKSRSSIKKLLTTKPNKKSATEWGRV
jgi:hypothetical protein